MESNWPDLSGFGMPGHEIKLMAELAAGASLKDAAKAARVSERTARRRIADPAFQQQLSQMRSQAISKAAGRLGAACLEAVDTLRALLTCDNYNVKVRAALGILVQAVNVRSHVEIAERLAAAESRLEEMTHGTGRSTTTP